MAMNPLLSILLILGSYGIASVCRTYVPKLAKVPFLVLMLAAFFLEIFTLVGVGVVISEMKR